MSKPLTGEPKLASVASWAVLVASFGLSATTWIALAELAGFTGTLTVLDVTLHLAWLMPVAVDGYVVVALVLWMSPVPAPVAAFAKKNTYGAAFVGVAAQSAYHLLHTASTTDETWRVVLAAVVGAAPPSVAAGAVHMRALIRRHSNTATGTNQTTGEPHGVDHLRGDLHRRVAVLPGADEDPVTVPASSPMTTPNPHPSIIDIPAVPAPVADTAPSPSTPDSDKTSSGPNLVPVVVKVSGDPVPTPATVAARLTKPQQPSPADQVPVTSPPDRSTRQPRPHKPATAGRLAPSAADTPVTESDRAQLVLPVVPAAVLAKAERVAREFRAEHGTPIRPAQLAARIKVNTEEATQALAVLELGPDSSTKPIPTVNGNRPTRDATR